LGAHQRRGFGRVPFWLFPGIFVTYEPLQRCRRPGLCVYGRAKDGRAKRCSCAVHATLLLPKRYEIRGELGLRLPSFLRSPGHERKNSGPGLATGPRCARCQIPATRDASREPFSKSRQCCHSGHELIRVSTAHNSFTRIEYLSDELDQIWKTARAAVGQRCDRPPRRPMLSFFFPSRCLC
jgi:hypothetical protein